MKKLSLSLIIIIMEEHHVGWADSWVLLLLVRACRAHNVVSKVRFVVEGGNALQSVNAVLKSLTGLLADNQLRILDVKVPAGIVDDDCLVDAHFEWRCCWKGK